jgi:hypothetical protein
VKLLSVNQSPTISPVTDWCGEVPMKGSGDRQLACPDAFYKCNCAVGWPTSGSGWQLHWYEAHGIGKKEQRTLSGLKP